MKPQAPSSNKGRSMLGFVRTAFALALATLFLHSQAPAQSRQTPPGMFKELDDEIVGKALIIRGKQLLIDDYLIEELRGVQKSLHQPVKHAKNPVLIRDQPWEEAGPALEPSSMTKKNVSSSCGTKSQARPADRRRSRSIGSAMRLPKTASSGRNRSSMSSGTRTS